MVTHEIDEAILLSDRIVLSLMESPRYYKLRNHILHFLHERFAHDQERDAAE